MDRKPKQFSPEDTFARMEQALTEERFTDVQVLGKDLLPLLEEHRHLLRMQVYMLLHRCPGFHLGEEKLWAARLAAEKIIQNQTLPIEERIRAHLLHMLIGPFSTMATAQRQEEKKEPKVWLGTEQREFLAMKDATNVLEFGGDMQRQTRRNAHVVMCYVLGNGEEAEEHLEALILDGEEVSIARGCAGVSEEFHAERRCAFLDRALSLAQKEHTVAALLENKLSVLVTMFGMRPVEEKERKGYIKWVYQEFIATFVRLEECSGALQQRGCGHLAMAMVADQYDEMAMVEVHLDIAERLFKKCEHEMYLRSVDGLRASLLGQDPEDRQSMDPEEREEEEGEDEEEEGEEDDERDADWWMGSDDDGDDEEGKEWDKEWGE